MKTKQQGLEFILNRLMKRYTERVPDLQNIISAMKEERVIKDAVDIENDHIAFRTIGVPNLGIASLEKIFLYYGFQKRDYYYFPEKKLNAYWYAPPADRYPRIFISELRVDDLSQEAREIIHRYTDTVVADPVDSLNLDDTAAVDHFLHSGLWPVPSWNDYQKLLQESEYAAWTIYNRYYLNHFTISVHNLKEGFNTIHLFNEFLERHGIKLNDSGGKIKQSPDKGLLQSSTVASMIPAVFVEGDEHLIAGSYVEFAERKVLPSFQHLSTTEIKREHRRDGFEAANADKIFESTYSSQTTKEK